jgi:hypothetical protein
MTNEDKFKSKDFSIPLERDNDDFIEFQKRIFSDFFENIDSFDGRLKDKIIKVRPKIKNLADSIISSLESYVNGDTIEAYSRFENGINQIKKHLLIKKGVTDIESIKEPEEFYRARTSEGKLFSRNEMFHIPFELRHLVNSQRYSLPGMPCLYLANSTDLCWEELGKPDFDKIQISRFDLTSGEFKFLNLNHTNHAISFFGFDKDGDVDEMAEYFVLQYLSTWPLQAAVSVIVKHRNHSFKPEYIIPQLLLQWVVNNQELDGIRFFSTKSNGTVPILHFSNLSNLVIPIKESKKEGLCEDLKKRIPLTNPVSYEYASLMIPQLSSEKLDTKEMRVSMKPISLKLHEDLTVAYENTKFGQLERVLNGIETENIK